jgi:hypothetical protein
MFREDLFAFLFLYILSQGASLAGIAKVLDTATELAGKLGTQNCGQVSLYYYANFRIEKHYTSFFCNQFMMYKHIFSVAIPRDYDVIFGIISKTNIARFGKENSRKYFISVPISLGYAQVYWGK